MRPIVAAAMTHLRACRPLIGSVVCVSVAFALLGCGSSSPKTSTSASSTSAAATAAWAARTQQLCVQKEAAIAQLGNVNITYGGIARIGLPAVKQLLDRYLGRLLGILRLFHQRQLQLTPPPSFAPAVAQAAQLDLEAQAATTRVRSDIANAQTANQLSAAFQTWLTTLKGLTPRGDALARQLNLPKCSSAASS
jgi:hypothetical protein